MTAQRGGKHSHFLVLYDMKQVQAAEVSQRRTTVSSKRFQLYYTRSDRLLTIALPPCSFHLFPLLLWHFLSSQLLCVHYTYKSERPCWFQFFQSIFLHSFEAALRLLQLWYMINKGHFSNPQWPLRNDLLSSYCKIILARGALLSGERVTYGTTRTVGRGGGVLLLLRQYDVCCLKRLVRYGEIVSHDKGRAPIKEPQSTTTTESPTQQQPVNRTAWILHLVCCVVLCR
jgi:hypothetical protein